MVNRSEVRAFRVDNGFYQLNMRLQANSQSSGPGQLFLSLNPMAAAKQTAALTATQSKSINSLVVTLRESIDRQTNNTEKLNAMVLDQATTLHSFRNTIEDKKQKIQDVFPGLPAQSR